MPTNLACHACMDVFTGSEAYICDKCETYQHRRCWNQAGRCQGSERCRGKPRDVVILRLEAPGPSAGEIGDEVEKRLRDVVLPPVESVQQTGAKQQDVERIKNALRNISDAVGSSDTRVEELRAAVDAGLRDLRRTIAEMDEKTHVAEVMQPSGVSDEELKRIVQETSSRMDESAEHLRESLDGLLSALSKEMRAELYRVQQAVDACRWDTGARRHPLPWDERPDAVFLPADVDSGESA